MSKISELAEATTLSDADMTVIDNETDGTRKFKLKRLKDASDGNATDISKLQDSMADEYDVNVSYSAGDYAMHEGTLYKATDTTTGAWDSSKWGEAQISDDVSELNSKIGGTYLGKGTYTNKLVMGSYGFVSGSNKNLYLYVPMNIAGDVTTISATSVIIGLRAGNGGYIGGADNTDITNMVTGISFDKTSGYISITATHSTSWHATNNIACVGTAKLTFTLS